MTIAATIRKSGHTVAVMEHKVSKDELGARVTSLQVLKDNVACWVQPVNSRIRDAYQARGLIVTQTAFFSADPGVEEGYVLVFEGRNLVVVGKKDEAGLKRLWAIHLKETG